MSELKIGENQGCCCSNSSNIDMSKVKNPSNPKYTIEKEFLKELEEKFSNVKISYANNVESYFMHNYSFKYSNAIVISHEMNQEILDSEIGPKAQRHNEEFYDSFGRLTYEISDYLRENGFETMVCHPNEELIAFSQLGQKAGLGVIGKSGLLISPEFGPKQKISAILVNIKNLPISSENPHKWIKKYCEKCSSCIKKCPENALSEFELNINKCIGCSKGCSECIKACPFYKKGYENIYQKFIKIKQKATQHP